MESLEFDIRPLTPQRLGDLLNFFEQRAFADHPKWASCYCHFPHADHDNIVWSERTGEQNRAATCQRVADGTMMGWLAYADAGDGKGSQAVGWCNAGPRRFIEGMLDEPEPLADTTRVNNRTRAHRRAGESVPIRPDTNAGAIPIADNSPKTVSRRPGALC